MVQFQFEHKSNFQGRKATWAGAAPINFNGLVRQYYLRAAPEVGDIQVNLVDKAKRSRQSHQIAVSVRARIEALARQHGGNAKVVDPGGNILATTLLGSGMAVADVDVDGTFRAMRAGMFHLRDRRPDVYGPVVAEDAGQWQGLAHA